MSTPQVDTTPLPSLTADDVRDLTDSGSFSRGQTYQRRGMISRTVRRGATLAGMSHGSSGGPYQVRATLATGGEKVADWSCTCPRGGFCKHVVALLLTWIHNPSAFDPRPSLDDLLADRDREALVDLIRKLLALEPALEAVLEKLIPPAPVAIAPARPGEAGRVTAPVAAIRRALDEAIDAGGDDEEWDDEGWGYDDRQRDYDEYIRGEAGTVDVDAAFAEATATGGRYEEAGRIADAAAIFAGVATMGMDRFDDVYESDAVHRQILAAGRGLIRCLEMQATLPEADRLSRGDRTELLDALYEIWFFVGHGHWDDPPTDDRRVWAGGLGEEPPLPGRDLTPAIVGALSDRERREFDRRWRAEAAATHGEEWRRRTAIAFGIALNGPERLGEAEVLALITAAELWWDQALFLLRQGRPDEATAVAARRLTDPAVMLAFADVLAQSGEDGRARSIRLVDERLWETEGKTPATDIAYLSWLGRAYAATGKGTEAVETRLRAFKIQPDYAGYLALKEAAAGPGVEADRWPDLRRSALKTLAQKGNTPALMEIHLGEGEIAEAIALLDRDARDRARPAGAWFYGVDAYRQRVAQAAERDFPDDAIRLYRQLADQAIAARQRSQYAAAAVHLAAIRRIHEATGRAEEWTALIRGLREEHRRLPALQQEFSAAGLS